jgi:hypothetical protein
MRGLSILQACGSFNSIGVRLGGEDSARLRVIAQGLVDEPEGKSESLVADGVVEFLEVRLFIIDEGEQFECYEVKHVILGLNGQEGCVGD